MPNVSPRLTFISWAHGAARPVTSAYSGPSASGWKVQNEVNAADLQHKVVASRSANRTHWEARIMAVFGVIETVPRGSQVRTFINDNVLVTAFASRFVKTNGKPYAGEEFWRPLLQLIAAKRVTLTVELADPSDGNMRELIAEVSDAAGEKLSSMDVAEAFAQSVPPRPRRKRRSLFPAFDTTPSIKAKRKRKP